LNETMQLIKELVSIPSPSGNTNEVITYVENYLAECQTFREETIHITAC
jgi:putative aminopeptidase FrvX